MRYVFSLALGPVQDFVAAARRTRDLWFGSFVLSECARAAGLVIRQEPGCSLIFPHPASLDDSAASFTNKILAIVDLDPKALGVQIRSAIGGELDRLGKIAFAGIANNSYFQGARAAEQIAGLIEVQWAAAPLEGDYRAARRLAEALLGARKQSRTFGPVPWGAKVPKSAIDGQRESVIDEKIFDHPDSADLLRPFRLAAAERLCGVSLLKRLGRHQDRRYQHHFLSTHHLAAWPLLERIRAIADADPGRGARLDALWRSFVDAVGFRRLEDAVVYAEGQSGRSPLGRYDGSLLFENRLPELFGELATDEARKGIERCREHLRAYLAEAGARPDAYFAILAADGDRMGQTIEAIDTAERHQELSAALTAFARDAHAIVEQECRGELVLAGGDDVLAFVPLHRALPCAARLAGTFWERLAPFGPASGPAPTLSVGLAVVHCQEPLRAALDAARAAERAAKNHRDALAILVRKRGGQELLVQGRLSELHQALDDLVELHRRDRVPDGLAHELTALARLPAGAPEAMLADLDTLVRKEAWRIVARKRPRDGDGATIASEDLELLRGIYGRLERGIARDDLEEFAARLQVAAQLAKAAALADPRGKPDEDLAD